MVMSVTQARPLSVAGGGIKINGSPVPSGFRLGPGRPITLWTQLSGLYGGDTVRFTIFNSASQAVFGPVAERKNWFTNLVELETTAPIIVGLYTLEMVEQIPLFPDSRMTFPFEVSGTPDPEPNPTGNITDFLSQAKDLLIVGAVVAGIVAVAPVITRVADVGRR
jgi:hypothetical protein